MKAYVSALAFALISFPAVAQAQSRVRDQGEAYVNLSFQYQASDRFFGTAGESRQGRELQQLILSTYGEVGLVDRWLMATASADLVRRNVLTEQGATTGLGDIRLGLWSELIRLGTTRVVTGLQVGLPTGDEAPDGGEESINQLVARTLPTGDGEVDIEPSVLVSSSFDFPGLPLRHYAVGQLGYWVRTRGFSDALSWRAELGTQVAAAGWDRVWMVARARGVEAFDTPVAGGTGGGIGLGDGVAYTLVGGEVNVRLPLGLSVGVGAETPVRGRGILDATVVRSILAFEI